MDVCKQVDTISRQGCPTILDTETGVPNDTGYRDRGAQRYWIQRQGCPTILDTETGVPNDTGYQENFGLIYYSFTMDHLSIYAFLEGIKIT